jgi:hypothetical protein
MMGNKKYWFFLALFLFFLKTCLMGDFLYTVDGKVYEGKMVAFKYNVIFFNVYKFGKFFRLMRFPLSEVWKMEFNKRENEGLLSPFEIESSYTKFRKGKRTRTVEIKGNQDWIDTGINVKIGQEILFSVSGSININENTKVFQNGELNLTLNNNKPLPSHPTGAFISKVGEKGEPFYVGDDKAPFHMTRNDRLYIGINDSKFDDNSGSFKVIIYY